MCDDSEAPPCILSDVKDMMLWNALHRRGLHCFAEITILPLAEADDRAVHPICMPRHRGSGDGHTASRITASTCKNGFTGFEANDVCCSASRGTCGGTDCSGLPGGPDDCCTWAILESDVMCDNSGAPSCILCDIEDMLLQDV